VLEQFGLVERGVAALALATLGMRQFVGGQGLTVGYALAVVLLPVWIGAVSRFRGARVLFWTFGLTVVAGVVVSRYSAMTHRVIQGNLITGVVLVAGTACGIGVILWARRIMPMKFVGICYGLGMVVGAELFTPHGTANDWKFVWAVPFGVAVLSAVHKEGRRAIELATLLLLGIVSAGLDSRSYFATFLLAAVLLVWQVRPKSMSRQASWTWTAVLMASLALGVYFLGSTLLVNGYLGQVAQARSIQQIDEAGSLILGGRPELAATTSLMKAYPWGFGVGVVPNPTEILVAKQGMAGINYDPNNGYVEQYMFGDRFELHSTFGDLWANYSVVGLGLVLVILFMVVRSLAFVVANRKGSAVLLFLSCWTLWNLAFSPLYSAVPTLMITLGLGLLDKQASRPAMNGKPIIGKLGTELSTVKSKRSIMQPKALAGTAKLSKRVPE